jgi:hypothetical protein
MMKTIFGLRFERAGLTKGPEQPLSSTPAAEPAANFKNSRLFIMRHFPYKNLNNITKPSTCLTLSKACQEFNLIELLRKALPTRHK